MDYRSSVTRFLRWTEKYTKTDMVYLASGSFWLMLEQASAVVLAMGLAVAFGHFANQDTYGNYKYVLSIAAILSVFSLSNMGTAIAQASARGFDGTLAQGFRLNLVWSAGFVVLGLSAALYYLLSGNVFLAVSLSLISLVSPFLNGFSLYRAFLVGKQEFRRNAAYTTIANIVPTLAVIFALFVLDERAIYLVAAYFLANTVVTAYFYFRTLKLARNAAEDAGLLNYGTHLSAMNVISGIADKIDSIIVFSVLGPIQLAVYSYAIAIPEQIKGLIKNVETLSMPAFAKRSIPEIKRTIWKRMFLLGCVVAVAIFLYVAAASFVFTYLFPVYMSSVPYSQIYALSLIFSVAVPLVSIFRAHKKTTELYFVSNIGPLALLVLLPIFTVQWGLMGAILSQLVYRCVTTLVVIGLFVRMKSE